MQEKILTDLEESYQQSRETAGERRVAMPTLTSCSSVGQGSSDVNDDWLAPNPNHQTSESVGLE
jgi:hypothetical protein